MRRFGDLLAAMRCCALAAILSFVLPCFATVKVQPNAVGGTNPKPVKGAVGSKTTDAAVLIEVLLSLLGF